MLCHLAERGRVRLSCEEINDSAHKFVPLLLVVLPQVFSDLIDVLIQFLDAAVDVALLGVSDGPKLVVLLDHFGEVPQFGWPSHVFSFEGVIDSLHVLQSLSCTFEFLVLPLLTRQHSLSDDGVLDVLVNCLVDVFEFFDCSLNDLIPEAVVAVVLPNPVSSQFLHLQLVRSLFFLLHLHLHLGLRVHAE